MMSDVHPWVEDPEAPLGARPHMEVMLVPLSSDKGAGEGFEIKMNARVPLGEVRRGLCFRFGMPEDAVQLVFDGRELNDDKTLVENGTTLPGPMARKSGQ